MKLIKMTVTSWILWLQVCFIMTFCLLMRQIARGDRGWKRRRRRWQRRGHFRSLLKCEPAECCRLWINYFQENEGHQNCIWKRYAHSFIDNWDRVFKTKTVSGWQFNRIFRPPNRPPKDGRQPKNEPLRVGDELGHDLGHDLGVQKILLNFHPDLLAFLFELI